MQRWSVWWDLECLSNQSSNKNQCMHTHTHAYLSSMSLFLCFASFRVWVMPACFLFFLYFLGVFFFPSQTHGMLFFCTVFKGVSINSSQTSLVFLSTILHICSGSSVSLIHLIYQLQACTLFIDATSLMSWRSASSQLCTYSSTTMAQVSNYSPFSEAIL